jgi:hypothetical protein
MIVTAPVAATATMSISKVRTSTTAKPPRPAKRHRPAPVQAQLELPSSLPCGSPHQFQKSRSSSPLGDDEPASNTSAEYQEWPMHGFLKRMTIRNEIRYGIKFSLEEVPQLCAVACPLYMSSASSSRHFSTNPVGSCSTVTRAKKTQTAPSSRSKCHSFTRKKDAMLVDLKENKGCSWKQIEEAFPHRSLGLLQVHYSTKLKGRAFVSKERQ